LRLCSAWRGSWEYWLTDSNRVDLSPSASLRVRDPFLRLTTLFQTSVGLARRANAPHLPLDARVSCLSRFLMRCLPPEGGFLFTSSRFGLLRSGVPERSAFLAVCTSPPGSSPSFDFNSPRSRIVTLLPPCSPFGPVLALLPFPSQGRYQLQYPPSPGSWFRIAAFPLPAQDCAKDPWPAFHNPTFMRIIYSGSLRSPFGFQCFPSLIFPKVSNYSFLPIHHCSCERLSCVFDTMCRVYFEPSSNTRSQKHPIFTEANTFISPAGLLVQLYSRMHAPS